MYDPDDTFEEIRRNYDQEIPVNHPTEFVDPTPYGPPAQPVKPGLNSRGRMALGIGAVFLIGGSVVGYQAYSANAAENEAKAQAIQLEMQKLKLAELKEQNRAAEKDHAAEKKVNSTLQASIDRCVNAKADDANKGFGTTYRDIVDACKAQYATSTETGADMETAAASQSADGGADISTGVLLGGVAVVVLGGALAVRRGTKPETTHPHHCH
ncbi:hypothetical protein [Streptomyces olivaceiscleroticus]|uniref:Uncharacterized protein n=1 Tax=Streptomyces olivaceiscleroticus TaxID=68245 RepID=A0ABP3LLI9_9ACTN